LQQTYVPEESTSLKLMWWLITTCQ